MHAELRNQTLVAAEVAKQDGFENTYRALIALVKELDNAQPSVTSTEVIPMA